LLILARRSRLGAQAACSLLLAHGPAIDRSGADDPDVDRWLRVCDPLGTPAIEDNIPDHSGFGRGTSDFATATPYVGVRGSRGDVHRGGAGQWRGILSRCEPDQGGRGQEEAGSRRPADCLTWHSEQVVEVRNKRDRNITATEDS